MPPYADATLIYDSDIPRYMDSKEIEPGVRITNDRCVVFDREKVLVIGDLHLGYERALEDEGMYLPRLNTESIRELLNRILEKYEPRTVVLLGDIKHDFRRAKFEGKEEVRNIVRLIADAAEPVIVKGNHDNYVQNIVADMGIDVVDYYDVGGYRLEHGHVDSGVRPVVIGHEHPSVRISGSMCGGIKMQCFMYARKEGVLVIPPFSFLSSGTDFSSGLQEDFMSPPAGRATWPPRSSTASRTSASWSSANWAGRPSYTFDHLGILLNIDSRTLIIRVGYINHPS